MHLRDPRRRERRTHAGEQDLKEVIDGKEEAGMGRRPAGISYASSDEIRVKSGEAGAETNMKFWNSSAGRSPYKPGNRVRQI